MKAYQFTIPQDKVTLKFEAGLARRWGGFTRNVAVGAWTNPEGKIEIEHVFVYTVALTWLSRFKRAVPRLFWFVFSHARHAGEKALYYGPLGWPRIYPTGN